MLTPVPPQKSNSRGFTLVEVLIVVSIIAVLMSLILGGLSMARDRANQVQAANIVMNLSSALDKFYEDEGYYPGAKLEPDENGMPELYEALLGTPKSEGGKAGRSAPYLEIKEDQIVILEDEESGIYAKATFDDREDPNVPKYILDPYGSPIWYRVNKGRPREAYMHRVRKFDIWSLGVNRENETIPGTEDIPEEERDDIGNW